MGHSEGSERSSQRCCAPGAVACARSPSTVKERPSDCDAPPSGTPSRTGPAPRPRRRGHSAAAGRIAPPEPRRAAEGLLRSNPSGSWRAFPGATGRVRIRRGSRAWPLPPPPTCPRRHEPPRWPNVPARSCRVPFETRGGTQVPHHVFDVHDRCATVRQRGSDIPRNGAPEPRALSAHRPAGAQRRFHEAGELTRSEPYGSPPSVRSRTSVGVVTCRRQAFARTSVIRASPFKAARSGGSSTLTGHSGTSPGSVVCTTATSPREGSTSEI